MTPEEMEAILRMEQDKWRLYLLMRMETFEKDVMARFDKIEGKVNLGIRIVVVVASTGFTILGMIIPLVWTTLFGGGA